MQKGRGLDCFQLDFVVDSNRLREPYCQPLNSANMPMSDLILSVNRHCKSFDC